MRKLLILGLSLCLIGPPTLQAHSGKKKTKEKTHYVKVKTKEPKYAKPVPPRKDYMYVEHDYIWNNATGTWDWNGNRWVMPPQPAKVWVPGHWKNTIYGWTWVAGYWK